MKTNDIRDLNTYIDHTLLKADTSVEDVRKLCEEAIENKFKSVCIQPRFVKEAKRILEETDVEICTVVGFPLGSNTAEVKAFETRNALENGATEIDMVINVSALKDKDFEYVREEIAAIRDITRGKILKVIIEACLLSEDEIIKISEICSEIAVDFVKTSTGFSTYGARLEDVALIKKAIYGDVKIKASGGIKSFDDVVAFIEMGVARIGTSSGIKLMQGLDSTLDY